MHLEIPCCILRGGTSKGVYLMEGSLPPAGAARDAALLRLMGSPDLRQIDGLGGATSVTSKVAIISPCEDACADVNYTFAQVSIDKPVVSYAGNCGNISSGVGPFAIESGLVSACDGVTPVRIYNTNTQKVIIAHVQTPGKKVCYDGNVSIAGVPGTAAPVRLSFERPAGSVTGMLLPTGNTTDTQDVPGVGTLRVSIVDAANPLVFVMAHDLGLTGKELPAEINGNSALLLLLERVRAAAALRLGFINTLEESATRSPGVPKLTLIAPAEDYTTLTGETVSAASVDILGRMMSMQKAHETYALTGVICTICAACIPGTLVHALAANRQRSDHLVIGHPGGILEAGIDCSLRPDGTLDIKDAYSYRTARLLMRGMAYI